MGRDLSLKGTNPNLVQFTSDCFGPRFDAAKWEVTGRWICSIYS